MDKEDISEVLEVNEDVVASDTVIPSQTEDGGGEDSKIKEDAACGDEKSCETDASENSTDNPFGYLHRDEFTSERFKIEVSGLPRYYGFGELRKLFLNKLKLNPHKLIPPKKGCSFMYVNFKSEDERQQALKKIEGFVWKNRTLSAKYAKAVEDPLVKKRMNEDVDKSETGFVPKETIAETVQRVTTPWWNIPYTEQLERKMNLVSHVLSEMKKGIRNSHKDANNPSLMDDTVLEKIKASPKTCGYRNKCEFTIGYNPDNKEKTVGFRISRYKEGSTGIGPVDTVTHIPECMRQSALKFQDFVRQSKFDVYDAVTHVGCYRQLTVRTTRSGDVMMIVFLNVKQFQEEEFEALKQEMKDTFSKEANVKSFYVKHINNFGSPDDTPPELLFGKETITEQVLQHHFEISPEAFFQVNIDATEVLYNTIRELLEKQQSSTLLDVCSGTGTIGISVSDKCLEVLGIEMVPSAVNDAQKNAEINGLSDKCTFFAGKAEDIIEPVIARAKSETLIAIVDPPRAGLHQKVVFTLRKYEKIQTLIYVACNAKAAMKNFIDLARPSSNSFRGTPFIPVKLIPVDMFPNSPHFELIIVFERLSKVSENGN